MTDRIDKTELVGLVSRRVNRRVGLVGKIVDTFLEEIYEALKPGRERVVVRPRLIPRPTRARELGLQVQPFSATA